jgi:hypothetical protein
MTDTLAPAAPTPANQPSLDDAYQRRVTADAGASAVDGLMSKYGKFLAEPASPAGPAAAPAAPAAAAGPSDRLLQKYGPQAATAASAVPPAPGEAKPGEPATGRVPLGSTVGGMVGATAHDILKGILVEAPRATWRGVNDAVNSFGDALTEPFGVDLYKMDEASAKALGVDPSWFLSKIAAPETYTGSGIEHVAQFVAGMVPVAKALQSVGLAATVGRPLAAAAAGAIGNMLSSPSHSGNLSNLIESVPALRNPVTGWLASDPGDSVAEGKLKQGLEGAGFGAAVDGVLGALKVYREARDLKGALPEAAVSKAEGAAARPAEAAAPAVSERDWLQLGGKPEAPLFATATETAQASAAKLIQAGTPDEFSAMLDQLRKPTTIQKPQGLLSWLQRQGGVVDEGGELRALDLHRTRPGLINKAGMSLDDAALAAQEEGFIGEAKGAGARDAERASINDLLGAIDRESHGSPVYRRDDLLPDKVDRLNELQGRLNQLGLDPKTASNEEIGRALEEHAKGPAPVETPPSLAAGRQVAGAEAEGLDLHEQPAQTLDDIARETGDPGYAAAAGEGPGRVRLGPDKIGNINLNRISGEADIREVVRQVAGELDSATGTLTTQRRGWDAEQASADRMLRDDFIVRRLAGGQGGGTAFTASEARATQLIINNLGANAKGLAAKIASGQGTDLDKAALIKLGTQMEGWLAVRSGAMREAGRALAIGRMMGETSKGAETALRGLMAQGATAERMAAVLNGLDKPEQVEAFFKGPWAKRVGDAAFEGFMGGILSNPWTHARNTSRQQHVADVGDTRAGGRGAGQQDGRRRRRGARRGPGDGLRHGQRLRRRAAGGGRGLRQRGRAGRQGRGQVGRPGDQRGPARDRRAELVRARGRLLRQLGERLGVPGAGLGRRVRVHPGPPGAAQRAGLPRGVEGCRLGRRAHRGRRRALQGRGVHRGRPRPGRRRGRREVRVGGDRQAARHRSRGADGLRDHLGPVGVGPRGRGHRRRGRSGAGAGRRVPRGSATGDGGLGRDHVRGHRHGAARSRGPHRAGRRPDEAAARRAAAGDDGQADAFARNLTLRDPLGPIANYFAGARKETPFARYVVPFIQTPANALQVPAGPRQPLALATPRFWSDLSPGAPRATWRWPSSGSARWSARRRPAGWRRAT